jgi:(E)-4-hydroxy-3-methylbut-2-enyl-diphosphate synthase
VIRIGANGGSLNREQLEKTSGDSSMALVGAVEEQLEILQAQGFEDIILSAKATNITQTLRANEILASRYAYPLHIGITEAGSGIRGIVKSACGLGLLLSRGIGDTLRVSLTGPSPEEVRVGYAVLRALDLRRRGPSLISCPTCGRRKIDVFQVVQDLEPLLKDLPENLEIAVMGCEVNGPREAAQADLGVAGTPSGAVFFSQGIQKGRMEGQSPRDIARALRKMAGEVGTTHKKN